jgi:7,8-dihydropterin-6-yl-methyl-4-(beta-D-ribofuranosyl)aminobenzene 5'-phosphate synthase
LLPARPDEIGRIASALRDKWQVAWLAPAHCTGEPAFAVFEESFGDHHVYAGLGTTFGVGPKVTTKAEAGQLPIRAMDVEDEVSYRVALARQMRDALAAHASRL